MVAVPALDSPSVPSSSPAVAANKSLLLLLPSLLVIHRQLRRSLPSPAAAVTAAAVLPPPQQPLPPAQSVALLTADSDASCGCERRCQAKEEKENTLALTLTFDFRPTLSALFGVEMFTARLTLLVMSVLLNSSRSLPVTDWLTGFQTSFSHASDLEECCRRFRPL
jgi:hypothetical protein